MPTAYELVQLQSALIKDLVQHHVVGRKTVKLEDLDSRIAAIEDTQLLVFAPPIGRGGQWKRYRDRQRFYWNQSGKTEMIQGIDEVASRIGWPLGTFRTKFSKAHEVLTISVVDRKTGFSELVTITRG